MHVLLPAIWPGAGDREAACLLAERLRERLPTQADRLGEPDAVSLIACLGGHSPYLADLAVREADLLTRLLAAGPDACVADALALLDATDRAAPRPRIASALRAAKRQVALSTAIADLGGIWSLEDVTAALSRLAERSLTVAVEHLVLDAVEAGRLRHPSGFAVIGMGKLGAGELNYSSDVDLLLLYEPQAGRDPGAAAYARLARDLVALMQARDADGYVFRVDLRLRPDPGLTPPALSFDAALSYYEGQGATWERAALSKARPVAGDLELGRRFLEQVAPFIWRRHLDFAAIEDMRAMKARIDRRQQSLGGRALAPGVPLLGHDLKLGQGGIREIEFAAQTLQLVWGGREPGLRARGTLAALQGLAAGGRLPPEHADALGRAYRALRQAEHRLQMVADRQTHALPSDARTFEAFAQLMGERDGSSLTETLLSVMLPVQRIFGALFTGGGGDGWEAARERAGSFGFERPEMVRSLLEGWQAGMARAFRHSRARDLFGGFVVALLSAIGRQRDPDVALARLGRLLDRLPAGVQIFSLLARNPGLIERVADLLGASPVLADHLASAPGALEGLLAADAIDPRPGRTLSREISGARDGDVLEVAVEVTRRFVRADEFRLALAELEGRLDVDRCGAARSALADAALGVLLGRVRAAHEARFGRIGGGLVVVALGKAGSREMMSGSDLDLMLIYDAPEGAESTGRGARALPAGVYYGRLSQAIVAAVTARGRDGALYEVDMRLRPSGRQGPVAVSLRSFERYHRESAWTWERMALTRARVVAGPPGLRRRVGEAIAQALDGAPDAARVRTDAVAMRRRLLQDKAAAGPWDVKMRPGGLVEVEFIAQALQLGRWVPRGRRRVTTRLALRSLARAGSISRADAGALAGADRFWRTIQSTSRLLAGPAPAPPNERLRETIASALALDGRSIETHMDATARMVRDAFTRYLGPIEGVERR